MNRHAAAIACTVSEPISGFARRARVYREHRSANVYKFPKHGSLVIGTVAAQTTVARGHPRSLEAGSRFVCHRQGRRRLVHVSAG